jgi:hypothetical protein
MRISSQLDITMNHVIIVNISSAKEDESYLKADDERVIRYEHLDNQNGTILTRGTRLVQPMHSET